MRAPPVIARGFGPEAIQEQQAQSTWSWIATAAKAASR